MIFSKKITAIAVGAFLLCVLIFGVYFAIILSDADKNASDGTEDALTLVEYNKPSQISAFSFDMSGKKLSFYRHNGHWLYSENTALPVSHTKILALLSHIEYVSALRVVDEDCHDYSEYGLDSPKYTLEFTCDGEKHVYCFGNVSEYYSGYYFRVDGSHKLYILSSEYVTCFQTELDELLELDELPPISKSEKLVFTSARGAVSGAEDRELITLLDSVEIDRFIDCGNTVYSTYNLDSPATLLIDGDITLSFSVGESRDIIYLLVNESQMIYTVKCDDMEKLASYIEKGE